MGGRNKGFQEIKITSVLINNNEQPKKLKVQVSNSLKGFALTDSFEAVAGEYDIKNLESVTIQPKTSPQMQYEKMDKGTATEKDVSYGISIVSDRPIETVIIKYQYYGLPFVKNLDSLRDSIFNERVLFWYKIRCAMYLTYHPHFKYI
ncbi:hypothetical protein [Peribacillus loiseleuriae]|uniref:Uncharacterized protein n=1 Tax=Peribacillus loiseleuriae TaxID=1679170 RepID=A0A0K9GWB3_9BACI|nr:hypothetical protein [Peribacillus loiseleuriae]KMY50916.1 hypothetical protein AC625_16435 [Peribacillus loiseleuriae]